MKFKTIFISYFQKCIWKKRVNDTLHTRVAKNENLYGIFAHRLVFGFGFEKNVFDVENGQQIHWHPRAMATVSVQSQSCFFYHF